MALQHLTRKRSVIWAHRYCIPERRSPTRRGPSHTSLPGRRPALRSPMSFCHGPMGWFGALGAGAGGTIHEDDVHVAGSGTSVLCVWAEGKALLALDAALDSLQ